MSKKTRKEKIIADLRKKLAKSSSPNTKKRDESETPLYTLSKSQFKTEVKDLKETKDNFLPDADKKYIINDLRKTFLLTGTVLAIEFVLFYLLEVRHVVLPILF